MIIKTKSSLGRKEKQNYSINCKNFHVIGKIIRSKNHEEKTPGIVFPVYYEWFDMDRSLLGSAVKS